jgi:uncharacterized protein YcbK (DUF882 family)
VPTTCDCSFCRHEGPPAAYAEGDAVETFTFGEEPARFSRRGLLCLAGAAGAAAIAATLPTSALAQRPGAGSPQAVRGAVRRLVMVNSHTGESFDGPLTMNGRIVPLSVGRLNMMMRDHMSGHVARIDLRLYDLLARIQGAVRRPLHLISGYRSWQTNEYLRSMSGNVAENSFHIRGMAADFYVEGARPSGLARIARTLGAGGVGMYRGDPYIHVDTGPRRSWFY